MAYIRQVVSPHVPPQSSPLHGLTMAIIQLAQDHIPIIVVLAGVVLFVVHRQIQVQRESKYLPPGPPVHFLTGTPNPGA